MPYQANVYQVMIASPSDVAREREIIKSVLHEWNFIHSADKRIILMPVGWETHSAPLMGERPQAIINKQILENCDLLIGAFWTRIGTPTGEAISGTVEEIEKHISASKPAMLYFSSAPVHPDSIDPKQYEKLKEFKGKCSSEGLVETYESLGDFREKFTRQLAITINNNEYFKINNIPSIDAEKLMNKYQEYETQKTELPNISEKAKTLLIEASQDRNGIIMKVRSLGGLTVQTNGKQFVEKGNPRSEAAWEAAITELYDSGFLQDQGYKGEVFSLTNEGYRIADLLSQI